MHFGSEWERESEGSSSALCQLSTAKMREKRAKKSLVYKGKREGSEKGIQAASVAACDLSTSPSSSSSSR